MFIFSVFLFHTYDFIVNKRQKRNVVKIENVRYQRHFINIILLYELFSFQHFFYITLHYEKTYKICLLNKK